MINDAHKNREAIANIVSKLIADKNEEFIPYFDKLVQNQPELLSNGEAKTSSFENIMFSPEYTHVEYAEALLAVAEYANIKVAEKQTPYNNTPTFLNKNWADFFKDGS